MLFPKCAGPVCSNTSKSAACRSNFSYKKYESNFIMVSIVKFLDPLFTTNISDFMRTRFLPFLKVRQTSKTMISNFI